MERIAYVNGEFVREKDASLHISDLAIQRGYGVFDFFRVLDQQPVFMEDHVERFLSSANTLGLDPGRDRNELANIARELIKRNQLPLSGIKFLLTGGYSPDAYLPAKPNLVVTQQILMPRPDDVIENGLKVITYKHVRELPEVKSINYLTAVLLQKKIRQDGADDALYHYNGEVSEFPRSNFFIVTRDECVVTPSTNVLKGITRKKTLDLAAKHFRAEERIVTMADVRNAKEAFVTSTTKQVLGVVQVDDIVIGDGQPGEITRFLDGEFQKLIHGRQIALL